VKKKYFFKDVISHLNQKHRFSCSISYGSKFTEMLPTNCLTDLSAWLFKKPIKIKNGTIFFLAGLVNDKFANFWIYGLLSPLETKNYAYTLSITGENGAKFSYYNYVKPLDEAVVDIVAKQLVFVIGTEAIKEMRNQDNKLPLEVTIHDLKKEAAKNETFTF